jgi:DNA-binding HxlR family transcriptional regulator
MALFDLLGRSWAMGVLWTLCEAGPSTFRAIQKRCETISPTVLNRRLKELQAAKLVKKTPEGYAPTDLGRKIHEQLVPLGATAKAWGRVLNGETDSLI